jgi:GNAT superfamily N-acetyltransferase
MSSNETIDLREFEERDWGGVWTIVRAVAAAGETFVYERDLSPQVAREIWLQQPPGRTVVAVDSRERVLGTAKMGRNQAGPGAHVGTASFMVAEAARGRGVGTLLARHVIQWASNEGFLAMQFNAVVETNVAAVALWRRLGFSIIGTVPAAFDHPRHGLVGLHVMHRFLEPAIACREAQ